MNLYGKKTALTKLRRYCAEGTFPHAVMLCGDEGVGKRTLADYAAMMLLCESPGADGSPCMTCTNCRRIEQHIHPDVAYPRLSMDKEKYRVGELREFLDDCYKKPNDTDRRVIIFDCADEMLPACQNTLLKEIEEPLPFNTYIFTAADKSSVLRTVLSRVTVIECAPEITREEFGKALSAMNIGEKEHDSLFSASGGNIGLALNFSKSRENETESAIAANAADALAASDELGFLTALSSAKKREELCEAVGMLSDIFAGAAVIKAGAVSKGTFAAQKKAIAPRFML